MWAGAGLVLVVLAAQRLGFGAGPHRCPGERLAIAIATAGVSALVDAELVPAAGPRRYRPSTNARIALL